MTLAPSIVHSDLQTSSPSMPAASREAVMEYRANDLKFWVKHSEEVAERVGHYLRNRHPRKTADEVASETGISAKTVTTWLSGTSCPGGVALLRLIAVYGPDVLAAVFPTPPAWLDKAARDQRTAELEHEIAEKRRQIEALR